jgi:outer membrane receptor protein involved in Fe transport
MYHDLRLGYKMRNNLDLYVGVDNLTDEAPPLGFTGAGAGTGIYPNEGQFFYGGLNWRL